MRADRRTLTAIEQLRAAGLILSETRPAEPPAPPVDCTEAVFTRSVIDLAEWLGWTAHHARPARTAGGWRTPIQGRAGFPDLVLVRDRCIMAELKTLRGRLAPDQRWWRQALEAAHVEYHLWRPADWPAIRDTLR